MSSIIPSRQQRENKVRGVCWYGTYDSSEVVVGAADRLREANRGYKAVYSI